MSAFDILGDPVRRRILELLADGERTAGEVGARVQEEFGISQPAVSRQLRVLRESGFATVRACGTRRCYAVDPAPLREVDAWLARYRRFWGPRLDALAAAITRDGGDAFGGEVDEREGGTGENRAGGSAGR